MKKLALGLAAVLVLAAVGSRAADYSAYEKALSGDARILHALNRLTFGPRPGDAEAVQKLGLDKWIDQQLHPERITENPALAGMLAPLVSLQMSTSEAAEKYQPLQAAPLQGKSLQGKQAAKQLVQQAKQQGKQKGQAGLQNPRQQQMLAALDPVARHEMVEKNNPGQVPVFDLMEGKLYRAIYSERQLQEEMVDFWFNHFNVFIQKGQVRLMTAAYERDAIRPYVLGHFRDLLGATAQSPAMMFYLDNWQSVSPERIQEEQAANQARLGKQKGKLQQQAKLQSKLKAKQAGRGLNENYARELMELHTMGVDGGYTQDDVINVARAFTGWTINQPRVNGEFMYNDRVHDKSEKTVLGVKIRAGGDREDGEKVLDILVRQPATAHFISLKLAQRFVADDPPPALVDRMAETFRATDGDIRAVMETMLHSKEFFSEGALRAKVKTPVELVVSAVRAVNADVKYAIPLANQIADLGEPLYRKVEPTGYSAMSEEWVNSAALLARMNYALALAGNRLPGSTVKSATLTADPAQMARQLLMREPSAQTLTTLQKAMAGREPTPELVAGLVLGSPDFQRR